MAESRQQEDAAGREPVPVLSLITQRRALVGVTLDQVVQEAVRGGVNHVQLRESDLIARELLHLAEWLREVIGDQAVFVVWERVDVALAAEADGVHLPANGLPTRVVRKLVGSHHLIGRSAHTVNDAVRAARDGADYVLFGPVFASPAYPNTPALGPGTVEIAARQVSTPLIAFGGLDTTNLAPVLKSGATGVAVGSSIMKATDPFAAAGALQAEIMRVREGSSRN